MANSDGHIVLSTKVDLGGIKKGLLSLKSLGKGFAVIGVAATAATAAITKMAVSAYADYEQLIGGVETLFKDSAGKVVEYANQAFQTAGISANEYIKQVTSFSASLLSSLAGDTDKAADIANMALIDISDNANKMGSSLESVTLAYQGFAKGQYMLLDNLKLGYGGTKTEMQRLLKDAEAYLATQGKTAKFSIDNLADVYTAINAIQQKLGIAGTTMEEAESTITGSLGMVKSSWQNLITAMSGGGDLDRAINNLVYSLEKFTANITPVIERTLIGLGQAVQRTLPMLVQTVVTALVQQIPTLVIAVYSMIVGLFKGIVLGIKALFTGGTTKAAEVIKKNIQGMSSGAGSAAKNMNKVADATKKVGKEAKKTLASFDEINILSSNNGSGSGGKTPTVPSVDAGAIGGGGGGLGDIGGLAQEIDSTLIGIMAIAGSALVAIGLLLMFSGNIPYGIGYIIAGAITFGVAAAQSGKTSVASEVIGMLETVMAAAGGALLALGIILLWIGGVVGKGVAIGMIIAGAGLFASAVATKSAFSPDDIAGWLSLIIGVASGALLALGIILCMVGSTPLGVGMIIAGAIGLVSAFALNYNEVTDKITGWVAVIMAIAGASLLVLGIVLTCSGNLVLGIPLILAGAVALVTPIALNWDIIKEKATSIFDAIFNWIKTWGLLVLGIILCISGVGIPLGIALIKKGAGSLTEAQDPLWETIVDKVKDVWARIKEFWNQHIAKWFTKEHWAGLARNMMNGLIEKIEQGLNKLLSKFHDSKIGQALDYISGGLGFTIPNSISIPRLARGAVIPPNREFLAVLGDQKHGTNIEAPAELIKQMAMEAMLEIGMTGQPTKEEHYYLNETELMSVIYKLVKGGERIKGNSLITGGVY